MNSGYAGFGNAFTNPFQQRSNASHQQSGGFNHNPFGMSATFGMGMFFYMIYIYFIYNIIAYSQKQLLVFFMINNSRRTI